MLHVSCQMFLQCGRGSGPMLTINQILGPHSVQSETTLWWRTLVLDREKSRGKGKRELLLHVYLLLYIYIFTSKPVTRTTKQVLPMSVTWELEPSSASPLVDVSYFLCFRCLSPLLVFDDTAATPVDKPFHAVFPMDVAQVRVVICGAVKNLILY